MRGPSIFDHTLRQACTCTYMHVHVWVCWLVRGVAWVANLVCVRRDRRAPPCRCADFAGMVLMYSFTF